MSPRWILKRLHKNGRKFHKNIFFNDKIRKPFLNKTFRLPITEAMFIVDQKQFRMLWKESKIKQVTGISPMETRQSMLELPSSGSKVTMYRPCRSVSTSISLSFSWTSNVFDHVDDNEIYFLRQTNKTYGIYQDTKIFDWKATL
jgi:hypothetical protein